MEDPQTREAPEHGQAGHGPARTVVVLNEKSCRGGDAAGDLRTVARRHGAEVRASERPGDGGRIAAQAAREGFGRVVVAGGDGTVNEVLNGVLGVGSEVELGIVPCGTANDLARALGLEAGRWEEAAESALTAPARPCDVVRIEIDGSGVRHMLNACAGGFAERVSSRVSKDRKEMLGALAYWVTGMLEAADLEEHELDLSIDGTDQRIRALQVAVANGRFIGGGFPVNPDGLLDDGLLELIVAPVQTSVEIVKTLAEVSFGRHAESENLLIRCAARVSIRSDEPLGWSLDGEVIGPTRTLEAEVLPGAVRLATHSADAFDGSAQGADRA